MCRVPLIVFLKIQRQFACFFFYIYKATLYSGLPKFKDQSKVIEEENEDPYVSETHNDDLYSAIKGKRLVLYMLKKLSTVYE